MSLLYNGRLCVYIAVDLAHHALGLGHVLELESRERKYQSCRLGRHSMGFDSGVSTYQL
jgi:hypothetical protein